jgi:hypothetical protein
MRVLIPSILRKADLLLGMLSYGDALVVIESSDYLDIMTPSNYYPLVVVAVVNLQMFLHVS